MCLLVSRDKVLTINSSTDHTSNMPRYLPRVPLTPASSSASRSAVVWDSSVGSIPPPGTTHFSRSLLLVTSNNWKDRNQN